MVAKIHYFIKVGFPLPDGAPLGSQPIAPVRLAVVEPLVTTVVHEYTPADPGEQVRVYY